MRRLAIFLLSAVLSCFAFVTVTSCEGIHIDWKEYMIEPEPEPEPGPEEEVESRALAFYFTASWCTYCPNMAATLKKVNEKLSGRLITVSIHKSDAYSIGFENDFCKKYSVISFPSAVFNFEPTIFSNSETLIYEALSRHLESVERPCRISVTQDADNPGKVEASIEIAGSGRYRIFAVLMQDGIRGYQTGEGNDYVFDNVVRELLTSPDGDELAASDGGPTLSEGAVVSWSASAKYAGAADCYLTVALLKENAEGRFVLNNAACSQR